MNNVTSELELYEPMKDWLESYLRDKYKGYEIFTVDSHNEKLDKVLRKFHIRNELAIGLNIQVDVLGIAIRGTNYKLFFIEAKKTNLTLRDLGQLWAYCQLIDPSEAYLFSSSGLGTLNKILNISKREDLLDYGNINFIKKMKVSKWDINAKRPCYQSMVP